MIQISKKFLTLFVTICVGPLCGGSETKKVSSKILLCYYHPPGFSVRIPDDLCTHLVFAFAKATPAGIVPLYKADLVRFRQLVDLKKGNPSLKVLLSLQQGFGSVIDAGFHVMNNFSSHAVDFLKGYGFDGIDLDWEFPTSRQKGNYSKFIQILSADLQKVELLLSAALPNNPYAFKTGYDSKTMEKSMDLMTIMSYDFHLFSAHDNHTGYNSPLYTPKGESRFLSTASMVEYYLQAGISKTKLLMGLPTYGRSWKLAQLSSHELHAAAVNKGDPGPIVHVKGVYTYSDVCKAIQLGASQVFDAENGAVYLYDKNSNWVAFESTKTVSRKISYMKQLDLAGIAVWQITLDDIHGTCQNGSLPLINFIKNLL